MWVEIDPRRIEHLDLSSMWVGDWFLFCENCKFQLEPNTGMRPFCPNCESRLLIGTVTEKDVTISNGIQELRDDSDRVVGLSIHQAIESHGWSSRISASAAIQKLSNAVVNVEHRTALEVLYDLIDSFDHDIIMAAVLAYERWMKED